MATAPGQTLSHYRLVEQIGQGGMGVVWKALDTVLDRHVAIKILPPDVSEDPTRREMFFREAKLASQLSNAHIVQVYEFGQEGDLQFIVMELVPGQPLNHVIQGRPLPVQRVAELGLQIATAMTKAHHAGLLHRDLKPANVLVTSEGEVKVVDFGLAMLFDRSARLTAPAAPAAPPKPSEASFVLLDAPVPDPDRTELGTGGVARSGLAASESPGTLAGTLAYMSPEQARCEELDARSDIFSLGVILYELTTGQQPFQGATATQLLEAVMTARPVPAQERIPNLPIELARIVEKALAPRPQDRYQTMDDLAVDLRRFDRELASGSSVSFGDLRRKVVARRRLSLLGRVGGLALAATLLVAAAWQVWFRGAVTTTSIAVLPFENVGGDPEMEYLNDGITESLINGLSQFPNLNVIARSTVFRYKGATTDPLEVGRALKVAAILTGRVEWRGESLRVGAELVDVARGTQLWGERFNRRMDDIFALQDEISRSITETLRVQLSQEEKQLLTKRYTENAEAYQLYLLGRYHWNRRSHESLLQARDAFLRAIAIDPGYALAYTGLADAYAMLANNVHLPAAETMPLAEAAARRALELDERLAEAHASLAIVARDYNWDWATAEREIERSLELNPRSAEALHTQAFILAITGRQDESLQTILRARDLDPLSARIQSNVGGLHFYAKRYDRAIEELRRAIDLDARTPSPHIHLANVYSLLGRHDEALAEMHTAYELARQLPVLAIMAHAYAVADRSTEALRLAAEIDERRATEYLSPVWLALLRLGLRDRDGAFQALDRACDERTGDLSQIVISPLFDELRSDPRYLELRRRMNLPVEAARGR